MGANVPRDKSSLAMRSHVNWALLGLLIERPSYGYELVQRFERTYEDALELSSPSQIYGALNALERRSLIEELPADAASEVSRQPKPHYRATAEGVRGYQDWLVPQAQREHRRSELFARQLAMLEPQAALVALERYEQTCLDEAKSVPMDTGPDPTIDDKDRLAAQLVREKKRLAVGAEIAWARYARSQLEALG